MKKLIIISIIVAICTGCGGGASSVDSAISQVEKALQKVEKNKDNMTEADWQSLEQELEEPFRVIAEALESNKIGVTGRIKIMSLVSQWAAVMMEAGLSEIGKDVDIDRENFEEEFENVSQELEKAVRELENLTTETK
jgi:competence CoiA-like predicted nuclease